MLIVPASVLSGAEQLNGFEYTIADNSVVINSYKGAEKEIIIPESINGKTVLSISENAFSNCNSLISVTIPDCVINIGNTAFLGCTNASIICSYNSYAKKFAEQNGINYSITVPDVEALRASNTKTDSVTLTWNSVEYASGYYVFKYNESSKEYQKISSVDINSYSEKNLSAMTEYKYAVKAYISSNSKEFLSKNYAEVSAATKVPTVDFSVTSGNKKITVKWKECKGADGYKVYFKNQAKSEWDLVKTTKNLKYAKDKLKIGKNYYFTVKAYKKIGDTTYYSENFLSKKAMPYKIISVKKSADIYKSATFASKKLGKVKSNKKVFYYGKSGSWYKIQTNKKIGYVYNKAFGIKSNIPSSLNKDNMYKMADDILFSIGTSPSAIRKYVSTLHYSRRPLLPKRDDMVLYALKYHSGACYYYAALSDYLLERAGYEHMIVKGRSSTPSNHHWNLYKTSSGWRHLDSCPFSRLKPKYISGWTDSMMMKYRRGFIWDRNKYPAAK